jgi:HAD superfamily hydrolase (TIGR01509 family)
MPKPKVILFDCDGVLIRYPHDFIAQLEQNGMVYAREVLRRFNTEADEAIAAGNIEGVNGILKPHLEELGWKESAERFLDEQLLYTKKYVDEKLIASIQKLRQQGTRCCLATNQNLYRAKFILDDLDFKHQFDDFYISSDVGFRKTETGFWNHVLGDLGEKALVSNGWEVVYFDDKQENIDSASIAGIQSFLFTNIIQFERDMNMLGFTVSLNKY